MIYYHILSKLVNKKVHPPPLHTIGRYRHTQTAAIVLSQMRNPEHLMASRLLVCHLSE